MRVIPSYMFLGLTIDASLCSRGGYQYSTRGDLTQVKLTNGEDLGGSWKRPKAERKPVEGHAFGCAFLRRCRFRSACTPRNSYRDQKGSRGELNNLSLYVHNARRSVG